MTTDCFDSKSITMEDGFCLPYRLYIPEGEGPFPLLLYLHGAGERGIDNEKHLGYFLPVFEHPNSPVKKAVVVAPQCPEDMRWVETPWDLGSYRSCDITQSRPVTAVVKLLDQITRQLPIDPSRVYITGLSMGGYGTWYMLANYPEWFAAGMPICGGGAPDKAEVLANIPIRTFHCADDDVVPPFATEDMAAAIEACKKGKFSYTKFPNGGHNAWEPAYGDPTNMEWLFSNQKENDSTNA